MKFKISYNELKEMLYYNPETGIWTWLKKTCFKVIVGKQAGSIVKGYMYIGLKGTKYSAHILAWFYMTGEWPKKIIDHIDFNGLNNKWNNLREATDSQSLAHRRKFKNNTTGYKGVDLLPSGNFRAICGKKHLGVRDTAEEAHNLFKLVSDELHGPFSQH